MNSEPTEQTGVAEGDPSGLTAGAIPRRALCIGAASAGRLIRDVIDAGGELWVSGAGQSMFPTVMHADSVLLSPLNRPARRGDVILVPLGRQLVLHRVARIQGGVLQTQGDARDGLDAPVGADEPIARAIAVRNDRRFELLAPTLRFGVRRLVWFLLSDLYRRRGRLARRILRQAP